MIDAWSGPTPVSNQFPRSYGPNDGIRRLLDKIKGIETELRDMRTHLPGAGGIPNAALASPIMPGFNGGTAYNYAVTTTLTPVCSANIVVPTGCSQAMVHVTCDATAYNNSGADDCLYVSASAVGGHGGEAYWAGVTGSYGTASASAGQLVSGLVAGSNLVIAVNVRSEKAAWAASASNIANVNGTCFFLR